MTVSMPFHALPPALVVIAGPQASGKSTIASALAAELRDQGEQVALVELDQIAAMSSPKSDAGWNTAAHIFESVVGQWARQGMDCVIAEGSGSRDEVNRLLAQAPRNAAIVVVATTAPFEVALARAQSDPTRGISKERDFLRAVYEKWPFELSELAPDLTLDTSSQTIAQSVECILITTRRVAASSQRE